MYRRIQLRGELLAEILRLVLSPVWLLPASKYTDASGAIESKPVSSTMHYSEGSIGASLILLLRCHKGGMVPSALGQKDTVLDNRLHHMNLVCCVQRTKLPARQMLVPTVIA